MPDLAKEKLSLLMDAEGVSFDDLRKTLANFKGRKIHVVGDSIVDSLTRCSVIGGMTKTPTMSVRHEQKEDYVVNDGVNLNAAVFQVLLYILPILIVA